MGGCVASVFSVRNSLSIVDFKPIRDTRDRPSDAAAVTQPTATESSIIRAPSVAAMAYAEMFDKYYNGTLVGKLDAFARQRPEQRAIAWRPIGSIKKEEIEEDGKKKPWEFINLQPTRYMTYAQTWETMVAFSRGLREVGVAHGSTVGLYEETRMEWLVSCYGIWLAGNVGVTVYSNLGEDALQYAIQEAQLTTVVCNGKAAANLLGLYKRCGLAAPVIIYTDTAPAEVTSEKNVYSWDQVVAKGRDRSDAITQPTPRDTALIMYTSGTTGDPKGVTMTHGNCNAAVACLSGKLAEYMDPSEPDNVYLAYLPLAHILEFAAENVMLTQGTMLGYGNPRTLTDTSARPHGDLREFRPALLAGVPRVFDTIKKAVEGKLVGVKKQVFLRAYADRLEALKRGQDTPYYNNAVFALPRALLGGRVKAIISGGAPLSANTQEFLTVVFGCSVGQGYGLTETMACCTIQNYWDISTECIGGPLAGLEVKLRDFDEWKHTDNPPRGEICIRGPIISQGYYKQPQKTAEAFDKDGWFYTGDVGQLDSRGRLKIVGRVKALAKNAFGEYIALDALESIYVLNELALPNGVCVLVDGQKSYICALVLTDEKKAMKFAQDNGISGTWPAILENPDYHKKAAASLADTAKKAGKKPFECVKYVRVLNDEWTPENGVLTAAMKLKRRVVDVRYRELITKLFAE